MKPTRPAFRHRATGLRAGGFSLIEMMIVLAIMLVLYAMYFGFGSRQNQMQQMKKCSANLQKMYVAMQIYANDSAGNFPVAPTARTAEEALAVLVPRYAADTAIFVCPGSQDSPLPPGEPLTQGRISYAYYMGRGLISPQAVLLSDRQVNTLAKTAGQNVFSSTGKAPGNNHHKYGGNLLLCDGSMQGSPAVLGFPLPLATNVVLLNPKP
jgi:prepilin-type N-terminal cleavage/methylation domain-containing protein